MQKVYTRPKSPDYSQAIFQTFIKIRLAFDYESHLPLVNSKRAPTSCSEKHRNTQRGTEVSNIY